MKFYSTSLVNLLVIICLCMINSAEAQWMDDFSDGDFLNNPVWSGDLADFEVDANFELHLNAAAAENESHLSTPSDIINNAVWEIKLRMEFNPSSSNRAYVYLVSDQADLENPLNGYYVMLGNTADEVSLYKKTGSTSTKIIDGVDGSLNLSIVDLSIRVTRDGVGNWELFSDIGNTGTYVSEGQTLDATHTSSSYFGVNCDYTATRSTLFYFDNINVTGDGFIDSESPLVQSLTVVDATQIDLLFNEALDSSTAEAPSSYDWDGNNPSSASLSGQTVSLTFATEFPSNVQQSLVVTNVQDLAGNIIDPVELPFSYVLLGIPGPGDVVINEFMADPTPVIGMPDAEYVELFNTSESAFDLAGWNLKNTNDDEILNSFILLPGAHVIICDDSFLSVFSEYGDVLIVSSLTALSNTGDDLHLIDPEGEIIDEIVYTTSWYGGLPFSDGGYSLERKNPFLPCSSASNWGPSQNPDGGTPGTQNSIFIAGDLTPPELQSLSVSNLSTILLTFNENMDELSMILGTYTLSPAATLVPQSPQSVTQIALAVNPPLVPGTTYTLTIEGPSDCSGNVILNTDASFVVPEEPEPGDVIFNEVMADPSPVIGLPEVEYLEIYNRSNKTLELAGWALVNTTTTMTFGPHLMAPGEYLILCDDSSVGVLSSFGEVYDFPSFTALSNDGDDLHLFDSNAELMDEIVYSLAWYHDTSKDDGGYSIERINPELPCSNIDNWRASSSILGGTPGQVNAVLDLSPDLTSPVATIALLQGVNQVILRFSEFIELGSIDANDLSMSPLINISNIELTAGNELLLTLASPLDTGTVYTLNVSGIEDCSGNVLNPSANFLLAIPELPQTGDLIINEVLFNPRTGGYDFVEIYNRSARTLSLKNWKFANRTSGIISNIKNITTEQILIFPGEFKVVTEEPSNIVLQYPMGRPANYIETVDLPSYNDDEGYVILIDPSVVVHDEFFYSDDYHFALIDDLNGVSLERVDYERLTNDPTNWHSAAENVGWATPGYENSQLQPSNHAGMSFSVDPEVFSPDNDGYEDVLNINYQLETSGQLVNISIFDREGRLVRMLTRNEYVGSRGTISWDGINEEGAKARIGVYILFIELFDLEGNVSSTKKTCVLGGTL
jgi:hypothetical protein